MAASPSARTATLLRRCHCRAPNTTLLPQSRGVCHLLLHVCCSRDDTNLLQFLLTTAVLRLRCCCARHALLLLQATSMVATMV
jgi:hypothetical protein